MSISAVSGRAGPEVTSPFDFLTQIWYMLAVENFHLSLTVQKKKTYQFKHMSLRTIKSYVKNCKYQICYTRNSFACHMEQRFH
jgi:hypothetical protein